MISGKPRPKISWSNRRIRLGVSHHGAPSTWSAPVKDRDPNTRLIKKPRS
jgi:hypothetical protein